MPAVEFVDVDILFAGGSRHRQMLIGQALAMLDDGRSRDEILAKLNIVVGVARANLAIEEGEICVLMGLSGSGKSTLLRAVNGLTRVTRGRVLVRHDGRPIDVARCDAATMRLLRTQRIAMVFQQFALLPWRTVEENVGLGLELRGVPAAERRRIVAEKLKLVALDKWADKYAGELSGGMQQRVGLARAFATDADILLMDEPFSALDPLIRTKLQDELLALQKAFKKTIIFVSHDLDEALKLGNHIAILEGGRVVQSGTPEDIVFRPADDYVRQFVKHMNPLNVLKGEAVMLPAEHLRRDGNIVALDRAGRVQLTLDPAGSPQGVIVDGVARRLLWGAADSHRSPAEGDVVVLPSTVSMRTVVQIRRWTGNAVVLASEGRFVGICADDEIFRTLAGDDWRTEPGRPDLS